MSRMSLRRNLHRRGACGRRSVGAASAGEPGQCPAPDCGGSPYAGGNTRTLLYYPPFPIAFAGGKGARLFDLDGHTYLDLVSEQSAAVYGHSEPRLIECIARVARDGINLGGPNRYEAELAAAVTQRFPLIDLVRFTNSGTEANLMALARGARLHRRAARSWCSTAAITAACSISAARAAPSTRPRLSCWRRTTTSTATRALIAKHAARPRRDPDRADARRQRLHPGDARLPRRCCAQATRARHRS